MTRAENRAVAPAAAPPRKLAVLLAATAALLTCAPFGGAVAEAAGPPAPTVGAIAPNNGAEAGGTPVQVIGTGFAPGAIVYFGGVASGRVIVDSATRLTATSPAGSGTVEVRVKTAAGSSADLPAAQFAYDPPPSGPWLGLDGNNSAFLGDVRAFVEHGVAFDRSGPIEWNAGEGVSGERGAALERDLREGMIPVVTIEYRGYNGHYSPDAAFPTDSGGSRSLDEYVAGFVASASAIVTAHPRSQILFEPINEPWGYTTPQFTGSEYAAVIARVLPAAREAHIPPQSIYVGATGRHWVQQMYGAAPNLRTEVHGWYLHPYGPPSGSTAEDSSGIQSLPHVQAEMNSGQNNLIVSEIGYCALDVNDGHSCGFQSVPHSIEAGALLTEMLESAAVYHDAGWLRALLVYSRNDGGWAMQLAHGILTAQGEALEAFADAEHSGAASASGEGAAGTGPPLALPPLTGGLLCALPGAFVCGA